MKNIDMNNCKVKEVSTSMLKRFLNDNKNIEIKYISQFNHYEPHDDRVYHKTIIIYEDKVIT